MSGSEANTILLTGSQGSVGSVLARRLASDGPLALLGRAPSLPPDVPHDASIALIDDVDVKDDASVQRGVERAREQLGPVRALIHSVGSYVGGQNVASYPVSGFSELLELNYLSAVRLVKAALPDLTACGQGRVVLFASADAFQGRPGASAYGAAKAALLRFAEALAHEVADSKVCVHVIAPTIIDTAQNRAAMPSARFADWVTPEQIASTVEFLLSPASSGLRFAVLPMGR